MAEIKVLPGVNRPDLVEETEPEKVLKEAMDAGLVHVAIVGRTADGEIHVWGSQPDADAAIGLLTRGVSWMAGATQVQSPEDEQAG